LRFSTAIDFAIGHSENFKIFNFLKCLEGLVNLLVIEEYYMKISLLSRFSSTSGAIDSPSSGENGGVDEPTQFNTRI